MVILRKILSFSALILAFSVSGNSQPNEELSIFIRELELQAENGNFIAEFYLGNIYLDGLVDGIPKDAEKGFNYLLQSAEKGYADAQYTVAASYKLGDGVSQNAERAAYWYRQAALQGHANAQLQSALILQETEDYTQAMDFLAQAARSGLTDAQFILALAYHMGNGVPVNNRLAYVWYSIAAASGDNDAATMRDLVSSSMDTAVISDAQEEALEIFNNINNNEQ